jgi:short-subunit dehydrogenase
MIKNNIDYSKNKYALITGASGGIGKEFVFLLAKNNFNLILVARSENKLQNIATELKNSYGVEIISLPYDLSKSESAQNIYKYIRSRKINIEILINNAGIGDYGAFVERDISKNMKMINLNINTLTELTGLFLKRMIKEGSGKILNIASTAAFQPIPNFAVYAASKSYVLNFTEALHYELKGTNVSVSVLCPGPTATGFETSANMKDSKLFKSGVMNAKVVAEIGYKGMMNNKMTIIPGFKNKIMAIMSSITPSRRLLVYISEKMT